MKRATIISLALILGLCLVAGAFAADRDAIKKQVDQIVTSINNGEKAQDFKDAAQNKPSYVFIMEENGQMLVHPSLVGQSLKAKAEPAYNACIKATPDGTWVKYEWQGKEKNTYVRKTKDGLIVGSGY
jgi:fibronectin type 3 domain-containing protein